MRLASRGDTRFFIAPKRGCVDRLNMFVITFKGQGIFINLKIHSHGMGIKDFLYVDVRDVQNYIALAISVPLLWWGIKTIVANLRIP